MWGGSALRYAASEYFLLNAALLTTYGVYRHRNSHQLVDLTAPGNFKVLQGVAFPTVELQIGATLLITVAARAYRLPTASAAVATALAFAQLFVLLSTALTSLVTCVWYLLGFGLIFLLVNEQSPYGIQDDAVAVLTPQVFGQTCLKAPATGTGSGSTASKTNTAHIVFLYTTWSSRCRYTYPMFVSLADRFSTDTLRFARLDVSTWPRVAKQLKLDIGPSSTQLPTVVAFEGGEEFARVPSTGCAGGVRSDSVKTFTKTELINALGLDVRYARSLGAAGPPPPGKGVKKGGKGSKST